MDPRYSITDHVLRGLKAGLSPAAVAQKCGTSETFVSVMREHFERLGLTTVASSLCSSGLGLCHSESESSVEARIACSGCPLGKA
ncbi:Uncharacterised protein [Arcanobacterium haemolyticum]|nr:Uncharacterised protein [Arcanobacterium haemolyticum]